MKRIRWSAAAVADLTNIRDYLREYHRSFMEPTIRKIYDAVRSLRRMPYRGRHGTTEGVRELLLTPLPSSSCMALKTVSCISFVFSTPRRIVDRATFPDGYWPLPGAYRAIHAKDRAMIDSAPDWVTARLRRLAAMA